MNPPRQAAPPPNNNVTQRRLVGHAHTHTVGATTRALSSSVNAPATSSTSSASSAASSCSSAAAAAARRPTDIKEYMGETVARIRTQKRLQDVQKLKDSELQRSQDNAFRVKYKEMVKAKLDKDVVEKVDNELITAVLVGRKGKDDVVGTSPIRRKDSKGLLTSPIDNNVISFLKRREQNELELHALTSDIVIQEGDFDKFDRKRDSGVFTVSLPDRYSTQPSFEFTSHGGIPASIRYLQRIGSYDLHIREKLDIAWLCENTSSKAWAENSNKLQLCDLLSDVLNIKDDNLKNQKPPTGIMLELLQEAQRPFRVDTSLNKAVNMEETYPTLPSHPNSQSKSDDELFSHLAKYCYLVGPSEKDIVDHLSSLRCLQGDKIRKSFIPATILFQNENDLPGEMASMLPHYCFPSGAPIQVRAPDLRKSFVKDNSIGASGDGKKQDLPSSKAPSVNSNTEFFPSNPKFVHSNSTNGLASKQPYILMLGDHTYQQFCISQPFGVSFFETQSKTVVQTTYTLCMMSRFPFFPFLSHIINQCEKDMKFMDFDTPLAAYDKDSTSIPCLQLRLISDLFLKLNKTIIPIYPYLISNKKKLDALHLVATPQDLGKDCVAIIPDINLKLPTKNQERKTVDFKRSLYQVFYSAYPRNFEEISDGLLANIKFNEKFKKDFVPTLSHRLEKEKEESFLILQWALPTLLKYLPLDQLILCLGCAMTEMKIIVKHQDMNITCGILFGLIHLLRPLKWCSPFIVSVPDVYQDLIDSPVPIMLGMQDLPPRFVLLEGYVVVDPAVETVHLHPTDIVQSHTTLLPNASTLVRTLTPHSNKIVELSKKRKNQRQRVTINTSDIPGLKSSEKDETSPRPSEFIPLELDISNESCIEFSGAVQQFSSIVSNHILAILNTGINMQQKAKEDERRKRRVVPNTVSSPNTAPEKSVKMASPILKGMQSSKPVDSLDIDDTISDLTFTDFPTRGSENSGNRDAESGKGDSSEGVSIASSSSSIPSLRSDAPILQTKELGKTGSKFVTKVMETQMYSNFCQNMKTATPGAWMVDGSLYNIDYDLQTPNVVDANLIAHEDDNANKFDSLLGMFEIILAGTIPIQQEEFDMLKKKYNALYTNNLTREKLIRGVPRMHDETNSIGLSKTSLIAYKNNIITRIAEGPSVSIKNIDNLDLKYCTGLKCEGFCNTDQCSELCLALWQKKIQHLRRKKAAYQIVAQKYEKQKDGDAGRVEYITEQGVRLQPIKHSKETKSQYLQRKQVVRLNINKPGHANELNHATTRKKVYASTFGTTLEGGEFTKKNIQHRVFASGSCDDYTYALAQYYARKENKRVQRYLNKYNAIRCRFVRRFVAYCRRRSFLGCVIFCQAIIRGFLVANKFSTSTLHLDNLYERRRNRLMAKLVIRNYLRRHDARVWENWLRRKAVNLRKRRNSMQLPVAPPSESSLPKNVVPKSIASTKFINEPSLNFPEHETSMHSVPDENKINVPQKPGLRNAIAPAVRDMTAHFMSFGVRFKAAPQSASPSNITSRLIQPRTPGGVTPNTFSHNHYASKVLSPLNISPDATLSQTPRETVAQVNEGHSSNTIIPSLSGTSSLSANSSPSNSPHNSGKLIGGQRTSDDKDSLLVGSLEVRSVSSPQSVPELHDKPAIDQGTMGHVSVNGDPIRVKLNLVKPDSDDLRSEISISDAETVSSYISTDVSKRKTKKTPFGKALEANNYAANNVVQNSLISRPSKSQFGHRSDASVSSRSNTNGADDNGSTLDGEAKSDKNTMASSDKSDFDEDTLTADLSDDAQLLQLEKAPLVEHTSIISPEPPSIEAPSELSVVPVIESNQETDDVPPAINNTQSFILKIFGIAAADNHFTAIQSELIKLLYGMLREGVPVYKHGRKGKPSWKVLYCDAAMTKLYWRNPNVKRDKDDVEVDESFSVVHNSGSVAPAGGKEKSRRSSVFGGGGLVTKVDSEREILIRDIQEVTKDCTSEVLQRSTHKNFIGMEGKCKVLCLKTNSRSLDLEVDEAIWETMDTALQVIVEFYTHHASSNVTDSHTRGDENDEPEPGESHRKIEQSSIASIFNNQNIPEDITSTSTTALGVKALMHPVDSSEHTKLEYGTAGKQNKHK